MAKVKLFVVGAEHYGSTELLQTFKKGDSFEVEQEVAEKMLKATRIDIAGTEWPVLVPSGHELAAKYENTGDAVSGRQTKSNSAVTTKKRAPRKKKRVSV